MDRFRWFSLFLAVVLLVTGSPAFVARAQQPEPAAQAEPAKEPSATAYEIGAAAATVVNIPGRTATCVLGTVVGLGVMVITFGSGYRAAARVVEEGCRGPWVLTAEDLKGRPTDDSTSRY